MKCDMVLTVWGEWHMNVFLNYHLRTLLSPNNFPEFSKTFETIFYIFATGPDQKIISENEFFNKLLEYCTVEFITLDPAQLETPFSTHHEVWQYAIDRSALNKSYCLFLPPDVLWSDGSFKHLADLAKNGKTAIFFNNHIRSDTSRLLPYLDKKYPAKNKVISFEPRTLVKIGLENLHALYASFVRDSNWYPRHPEVIIRPIKNQGVLTTFTAHNPWFFRGDLYELTDHRMLPWPFKENEIHFITDSDDLFMLSLAIPGKDRPWYTENMPFNSLNFMKWWALFEKANKTCDLMIRQPGRVHYADMNEKDWEIAEHESNMHVNHLTAGREIYSLWADLYVKGNDNAATLLAMLIELGIASRVRNKTDKNVLLIPENEILDDKVQNIITKLHDVKERNTVIKWLRQFIIPEEVFLNNTEYKLRPQTHPTIGSMQPSDGFNYYKLGNTEITFSQSDATNMKRCSDYNKVLRFNQIKGDQFLS